MSNEPDNTSDLTQDLSAVEMLRLVLADVRDMKNRLGSVESRIGSVETGMATLQATVDDRLKDTRPIWQAINERTERIEARLDAIERELASMNRQFETFSIDHMRMRSDIRGLDARLSELERTPN